MREAITIPERGGWHRMSASRRRSSSHPPQRGRGRAWNHRGRRALAILPASLLFVAAMPAAEAFDLSGGVSVGGMAAGSKPRLAVTPHAGIGWRMESGLLLGIHEMLSFLPATDARGVGVYNQTSAVIGYATESTNLSAGPSLSIYSMVACNTASLCGRVVGLSPGGHVQVNMYFAGPLGVSVSASVDWIGGTSLVLPGGVAAMVIAGPVLRWTRR